MCSVQIFKFLAKIYIINLIFSQEYIFIAFSQESAFSFSQVSNTHLAKIYTTRIRVPVCVALALESASKLGLQMRLHRHCKFRGKYSTASTCLP